MQGIIYYLAIDKRFRRSTQNGKKCRRVPKWDKKLPNQDSSQPHHEKGCPIPCAFCAQGVGGNAVSSGTKRPHPIRSSAAFRTASGNAHDFRVLLSKCTAVISQVAAISCVSTFIISCTKRITFSRISSTRDLTSITSPAISSRL